MGYFKPLRRKSGVLTLVLALATMGGWVRSFSSIDYVGWTPQALGFIVYSVDRNVILAFAPTNESFQWTLPLIGSELFGSFEERFAEVHWQRHLAGVRFGTYETPAGGTFVCITCHYSSLVIPLPLLSAWLLLSKPRVARPKAIAELSPAEGA